MNYREVNFDGLVGNTHNYAGLSPGNLASTGSRAEVSHPRRAFRQALDKAWLLAQRGIPQAVFPPHQRPHMELLRQMGVSGTDREVLNHFYHHRLDLLRQHSSSSSMWCANAATITASLDSRDDFCYLTVANLETMPHRQIEARHTERLFHRIFADQSQFRVHSPIADYADEGAANHCRFASSHHDLGVNLFVYGASVTDDQSVFLYPRRQQLEASEALIKQHQVDHALIWQQNPLVIDQGVFHNDVIATANEQLFLCHSEAFVAQEKLYHHVNEALAGDLQLIEVSQDEVSVEEAVQSYLFNSQILTLPDGGMLLLAPERCLETESVAHFLRDLPSMGTAINEVLTIPLDQSMKNGGGPACLRLRAVLSELEIEALRGRIFLDQSLYQELIAWSEKYYREELHPDELADPQLLEENCRSLDELSRIMNLEELFD